LVAFLSQDWLDALRDTTSGLPPAPDATAVVQHVVNGTPDGIVTYYTVFTDGRITEAALGPAPTTADLTFTMTYGDARKVAQGAVELSAAYMQGSLKSEGSMPHLFALLPATHRPDFKAAITQTAEKTDF
jgi:hypothetical protein